MKLTLILVISLCTLQAFDFWTTKRIIELGGRETNWLLVGEKDFLERELGVREKWAWLIVAKVGAVVIILVPYFLGWWDSTYGLWLLILLTLFYGWAAVHNWIQFDQAREKTDSE